MLDQSITIDILSDELITELTGKSDTFVIKNLIKNEMPELTDTDAAKICQLVKALTTNRIEENVEIVSTLPVSFKVKTRKTRPVLDELIKSATKSILLTGYSISDHFEETLKLINEKSKQGIVVEMYVNKYDTIRPVLSDIRHTNRNFLRIYEYTGKVDDKMAALHAKTIIVDNKKMLISSANLSYHGLEGNIEIGVLISSEKKALQVYEIFNDLKRQKIFLLVDDSGD